MKVVTTNPSSAERIVMTARAEMAPRNTVSLLLPITMIAAILSPIF
jgi:hypothetical protein